MNCLVLQFFSNIYILDQGHHTMKKSAQLYRSFLNKKNICNWNGYLDLYSESFSIIFVSKVCTLSHLVRMASLFL